MMKKKQRVGITVGADGGTHIRKKTSFFFFHETEIESVADKGWANTILEGTKPEDSEGILVFYYDEDEQTTKQVTVDDKASIKEIMKAASKYQRG